MCQNFHPFPKVIRSFHRQRQQGTALSHQQSTTMPKLQLVVTESPRIVRPSRRRSVETSLRSIFLSGNSSQLNNQRLLPPASSNSLQLVPSYQRHFSSVSYRTSSPLIQKHAVILHQQSSPKLQETTSGSIPIRHNGVYVATFNPARRAFHQTAVVKKDHHFDTLKVVQRLKNEGFSEEQAVALMKVMSDVIEESMQNLTRAMVSREGSFALHSNLDELVLLIMDIR